ncbi:pentatricopeptide repeat-containing protein At2g29760, chloroplastic-like isoform X2 [Macadamia integrifolia]|uniref:pentatricopeptide repeat-containing protein At2g29760, chloroplastic-like isoform X2 n=1 Tax=Macadamia integrifolia TaxID=60698 RepID=UPI001C5024AA|nr:pentatricopeptide repeat-containing protein At2g29760, chloroplastic-like isoform X2 [Macadamia integrifolia]
MSQSAMRSTTITKLLKLSSPHLFLIKNCSDMKELMKFHCQFITNGLSNETIFLSALLSFSAISAAGDLGYGRFIFNHIDSPNVFMFNTMIRGYAWSATPHEAISLYIHMLHSGLFPNKYTFPVVVKASSRIIDPIGGKAIHGSIIKFGYCSDVYVLNSLMHMYESLGLSNAIIYLFAEISEPDVVSWNVVIDNFAQHGCLNEVLTAFTEMCCSGVEPNAVTVLGLISACSKSQNLYLAKLIHGYIMKKDLQITPNLENGLLDMYVKVGDVDSAGRLFNRMPEKSVITWTSMIDGLVQNGEVENARLLFDQIPSRDTTSWNAMLNGFIKAGDLTSAEQHFNVIPEKDLVSWNSIIVGFVQNKRYVNALYLFREMRVSGVKPDRVTVVSVLSVGGFLGALDHGEMIHSYMEKQNIKEEEVEVALMDMYCKCGAPQEAVRMFHGMLRKTVLAWSAIIVGLAMNSLAKDALDFFSQMKNAGIKPNEITFIGVLCACSYAGLVEQGRWFFNAMNQVYGIQPRCEHYGCMVDILGRAGLLIEAEMLIQSMPMIPDAGVWGALLGACKLHGEVPMAERVAKILTEIDSYHSGRYVLLSNIYASQKRWQDVENVREMMKARGVRKKPGFSLIELRGKMHQFLVGDTSHPDTQQIYFMWEEISKRLKDAGYRPDTSQVLFDIDDEEKEHAISYHSEKLAIALGFLRGGPRSAIRVVTNLRVCYDCHSAAKSISKGLLVKV